MNAETGEIIIPANRKITKTLLRKLARVYDHIEIDPSPIRNKIREIIGSYEHKFAEFDLERERAWIAWKAATTSTRASSSRSKFTSRASAN